MRPKDELKRLFPYPAVFKELYPAHHRDQKVVLCPWHDDKSPSLEMHSDHGYCHGSCEKPLTDIFEAYKRAKGCSFATAVKHFDELAGSTIGPQDKPKEQTVVCEYKYHDEEGEVVYKVVRYKNPKTFRQERWTGQKWDRSKGCMSKVRRRLFDLHKLSAADHVYLCSGEKDAKTLQRYGLTATTISEGERIPNWTNQCKEWGVHVPLKGKRVTVLQDADEQGDKHCTAIEATFMEEKIEYRRILLPGLVMGSKDDVTDWLEAGHTIEEFLEVVEKAWSEPQRPKWALKTQSAWDLYHKQLEPQVEIVEGILFEGLVMLGAEPKMGKSLLSLQLAKAVATGDLFLDSFHCLTGPVTLLSLEDGERRIIKRLRAEIGGDFKKSLHNLRITTEALKLAPEPDEMGLLKQLEAEVQMRPGLKLFIIDTLQHIRGDGPRGRSAYAQDVADLAPIHDFALKHQVAVFLIHHTRKPNGKEMDWVGSYSGTHGLSGSMDIMWLLQRERGCPDAVLKIEGRDIDPKSLAIRMDARGHWTCLGDAATVMDDTVKGKIYRVLKEAPSCMMELNDIIAAVEKNRTHCSNALRQMAREDPPRVAQGVKKGTWCALSNPMEGI